MTHVLCLNKLKVHDYSKNDIFDKKSGEMLAKYTYNCYTLFHS